MPLSLKIAAGARKRVQEQLAYCGFPLSVLIQWKDDLEFDLQRDARSKMRFGAGPDPYFEYTSSPTVGGRKFHVTWELELVSQSDSAVLLDLSIVEIPPRLTENPRS